MSKLKMASPATPKRYSSAPTASSPLASPRSSPTDSATRRSQYKSRSTARNLFGGASSSEPPQKKFLRERFTKQCVERARKSRSNAAQGTRRWGSSEASGSSDGFDIPEDAMGEDEDDEDVMQDELFARIMQATERKKKHQYRLSYQYDVGSSFDPDMEDVDAWEEELRQQPQAWSTASTPRTTPPVRAPRDLLSTPPRRTRPLRAALPAALPAVPVIYTSTLDVELEQLEAYERELQADADYAAEQAALQEFADIDVGAWSDFEEEDGGEDGMVIS